MRPNNHPLPPAGANPGDIKTVKTLLPYLWPEGRFDLRFRVVVSLALLAAAKVMTVLVPVILKYTVDELSIPKVDASAIPIGWAGVPVLLLLAYGGARTVSLLFRELQGAIFARVGE
ncbi:MAG: metal ABC transporter permease, partial [Rhodospirillaceae bacterium]|nr:metal ABC transporter permease [Rhodospirillaceae bacterium]